MRRGIKVLGLTAVAILAFGAVMASAASASRQWYTGSPGALLKGSSSETCEAGTTLSFKSKVGAINMELQATGVECLGAKFENPGVTTGTLRFTGVTVTKPAVNCSVEDHRITTNPLKTQLIEPALDKTHEYDLFKPAMGSEFVTVKIVGASCAIAGTYPLEGSFAGRSYLWATSATTQGLAFSPDTNTTAGSGGITFGGKSMTLEGTINRALTSGLSFEAK